MKVKVNDRFLGERIGTMVGLISDDMDRHVEGLAAVRFDGHGLYLYLYHPSRLTPVEEEK